MAQQPVLAAATLANQRDAVTQEVFGVDLFSSLSASKQTEVTFEGNSAFYEVTEWGKWYTEVAPDVTDLPSAWNEAFRALWVAKCFRKFRSPQAYHAHYNAYVAPMLSRLADHYTADWNSGTVLQDDTFTPAQIRKSVMALCIRQRTPVFPPVREVDAMIRDEFVKLWNERQWSFRIRSVQLTITALGEVQTAEAFVFDGMASKTMVIVGASGTQYQIDWLDATRHARMSAAFNGQTGRPLFFFDVDKGDVKSIQFIPAPDQAYTAYAVIIIGAPPFSGANSTDGLSLLPVEFRANLRDMVFAKCLGKFGREDNDAARALAYARGERDAFAGRWDNKGASRAEIRNHNPMRFANDLASRWGSGSIIGGMG